LSLNTTIFKTKIQRNLLAIWTVNMSLYETHLPQQVSGLPETCLGM
jgi:hypothetical protein